MAQVAKAERKAGEGIPEHWVDAVHEEEGGQDALGSRPQDGRRLMREGLDMLSRTGGCMTAWDEITGTELGIEGVRKARKMSIRLLKDSNVYTRFKRECMQKEGGKGNCLEVDRHRHGGHGKPVLQV